MACLGGVVGLVAVGGARRHDDAQVPPQLLQRRAAHEEPPIIDHVDAQVRAQDEDLRLRAALALARHYGVEDCLRVSIDDSYRKLLAQGHITSSNE